MKLSSKTIALFAGLAVLFGLALAAAQAPAADSAKDPVCGMDVKKSEAKAVFEYKGTTYYFCAVGCKDKFAQNPEKYLQKKTEKAEKIVKVVQHADKTDHTEAGCCSAGGEQAAKKEGHVHGAMSMDSCPLAALMHHKDVAVKVESIKDGIQVYLSSGNPEVLKKLQ
ncbi:MAG: YHS domain-containing protein, partial [Candidatus Aminicenantes bacterium]|nr:YHS domain-containing protein [Candidatus Aminicenantes bacterium]